MPYGMKFEQGKRKPVHLVIWSIVRDKQKWNYPDPVYVGAVQGLATLAGCGLNTAKRAIKDLCRESWLLAASPRRGAYTHFRAVHKGQGECAAKIRPFFDANIQKAKMALIDKDMAQTGREIKPELAHNSTPYNNTTLTSANAPSCF